MYNVGIASRIYDIDGAICMRPLPDGTSLRGNERRVTRTKTLDGGVVFADSGISQGDRTLDVSLSSTEALWLKVWGIFSSSAWITISTDEACFLAKINRCQESNGRIELNILISEDLTT